MMRYTARQYAEAFLRAADEEAGEAHRHSNISEIIDRFAALLRESGAWKRRDAILYQCRQLLAAKEGVMPLHVVVARKHEAHVPKKIHGTETDATVREDGGVGAGALLRLRDIRIDTTLRRRFGKIRAALTH